MFKPYQGGSTYLVDTHYLGYKETVYLPPKGMVWDHFTGQMIESDVLFADLPKHDQVWQREALPESWEEWRKEEDKRRKSDPSYLHPKCKALRRRWWHYRLNGVWMMHLGKWVYLTGLWWFHLNICKQSFGYPWFRLNDREIFYYLQFCFEDPLCLGLLLAGCRRFGKSVMMRPPQIEKATRTRGFRSGLQSNSKDKLESFWGEMQIIFRNMPDFFLPIAEDYEGKDIIRFEYTKRSIEANTAEQNEERALKRKICLNSEVGNRPSDDGAYDQEKLGALAVEELGKRKAPNTVSGLWSAVQHCMELNGEVIGKLFSGTTIDEVGPESLEEFVKIFEDSFPGEAVNGRTKTGLRNIFVPFYKYNAMDERTGINDDALAKAKIEAKAELLKDDPNALVKFRRNMPSTWEEAKMITGDTCQFDALILNNRKEELKTMGKTLYQTGNFEWVNGERDGRVTFVECEEKNARWKVGMLPPVELTNLVESYYGWAQGEQKQCYRPQNEYCFLIGVDPVDVGAKDLTHKSKGSMAAAYVYNKKPVSHYSKSYPGYLSRNVVVQYLARPDEGYEFFEDMIRTARYYGCQIMIENTKHGLINYLRHRGYNDFIMYRAESTFNESSSYRSQYKQGNPSNKGVMDVGLPKMQNFVKERGSDVIFLELIESLLIFNPADTQKSDETMALNQTVLGLDNAPQHTPYDIGVKVEENLPTSIDDLFPHYSL